MTARTRVVIDTNVVISAMLWHGVPGQLLELADAGVFQLCTSVSLLHELNGVLRYPKFVPRLRSMAVDPEALAENYLRIATVVPAPALPWRVSRDADDDAALACAISAGAVCLVSGDQDLLSLGTYHGLPILRAATALRFFTAA